jgi:RNA polymerase sigma-70 factor (ECF subfamily)
MSSLALTLGRDLDPVAWNLSAREQASAASARAIREMSEAELVSAAVAQEPGAFDLILERHRRAVYQICYRFTANPEDASDLTQEVFLRAYRGLRTFKGNAALGTWLHRISVNVCLNRVSAKAPPIEPIGGDDHIDSAAESASDRLLRSERAERVRNAVAQLPKKQRAALILRAYHELSHQEVANMLGTSVGAAKANVFHALQNLRKILERET